MQERINMRLGPLARPLNDAARRSGRSLVDEIRARPATPAVENRLVTTPGNADRSPGSMVAHSRTNPTDEDKRVVQILAIAKRAMDFITTEVENHLDRASAIDVIRAATFAHSFAVATLFLCKEKDSGNTDPGLPQALMDGLENTSAARTAIAYQACLEVIAKRAQ